MEGGVDVSKTFLFGEQCALEYEADGVYISIDFKKQTDDRVDFKRLKEKLNKKKLKDLDQVKLGELFFKKNSERTKIANAQEERFIDAEAVLVVSKDKMEAFLQFTPPEGGVMLTREQILEKIADGNITIGILQDAIDDLIEETSFGKPYLVAKGLLPTDGEDGTIQFLFDQRTDKKPKVLDDGKVDYKELNMVISVKQDQVLCRAVPPTQGSAGKNIFGEEIPPKAGKVAFFPKGKNVYIAENGMELLAAKAGCVEWIDGKVNVFEQFEVDRSIDASTGNIYFVGNVHIKGDVLDGYRVEAGGNIFVEGIVEAATLKAAGDIVLSKGIAGKGRGEIYAGKNIIAKYIENATVQGAGFIQAEVIMHSEVQVSQYIELIGRKGLLVGGKCLVGQEVTANIIGSEMGTITEIDICLDPLLKERHTKIKAEIEKKEGELIRLHQVIMYIQKLIQAGQAKEDKREMMRKALLAMEKVKEDVELLKEESGKLDLVLREKIDGCVKVKRNIHPGCKIMIGSSGIHIQDTMGSCKIHLNGVDVTAMPWRP